MASKYKITTYLSDKALYERVINSAKKAGMTQSKYVESLLMQESPHASDVRKVRPEIEIYDHYYPRQDIFPSHGALVLDEALASTPSERKLFYSEQITQAANAGILADFYKEVYGENVHKVDHDSAIFVFLRLQFSGSLKKNSNVSSVEFKYRVMYQPMIITSTEWNKYSGYYDFFNIRYLRQSDLINKGWRRNFSSKYSGVVPVFERRREHRDNSGFFIPVFKEPKFFSDRVSEVKNTFIGDNGFFCGVKNINNKERFNLKGRWLLNI
ncbi:MULTISPECIES: hypothetical protein [Serratia]|uniref:hypothetical protein n=1 Tax=Serratia TaxID=613 RepID=UPI0013DC2A27|nr:hypothetical protein [Serratia marcescens]MDT8208692.1 hypothetical protein [Serratia marcescens]